MNDHRDYPPTPPLPPSRRSSCASEMSSFSSRRSDSDTEVTTPMISPDYKLSPNFSSASTGSNGIADLAIAASSIRRSLDASRSSSPQSHIKPHSAEPSYFSSGQRHSFDSKAYPPTNVYAAANPTYAHHSYLPSEPYPYPRQRAASSPNNYSTTPGYPHHHSSYYGPSHSVSHTPPVYRGSTQMIYSSPPTPQDRRKAHILSEQKRRESINGGFDDLKQILNTPSITRALSSSSHSSTDHDSDSKGTFDTNSFLGGGNRDSKAATLRKAGRAIQVLADALNEKDHELAMLRKQAEQPGATKCKAPPYNEQGLTTVVHDLTLEDDEMKVEDCPSRPRHH